MRDWLTVIIALLILGVLLDGFRRMRAHRRQNLKMSSNLPDDQEAAVDERLSSSEFPSGGPRIAARRDEKELEHVNQHLRESYAASRQTRGAPSRIPEQVSLNLDTSVPMLMDSVGDSHSDNDVEESSEPALGSLADLDEGFDSSSVDHQQPADTHIDCDRPLSEDLSNESSSKHSELPVAEGNGSAKDTSSSKENDALTPKSKKLSPRQEKKMRSKEAKEKRHRKEVAEPSEVKAPDEVLIVNVMARRGELFAGPELLDAMVSQNLKFGDMDIFHRHEHEDGQGSILFSVANIVVPGTFEVGAMEDFQTPGVSMFLSLPISGDSIAAFDLMAKAAQAIANQLNGELKDENRSVMTRQTIEHARQRVVEYERKKRLAK